MFVNFSWLNATAENFLLKAKETPDTKLVLGKPVKTFWAHQTQMGTLARTKWAHLPKTNGHFKAPGLQSQNHIKYVHIKPFGHLGPNQHYWACMSPYNCLNDDNTWIINNTTTHAIIQLTMLSSLGHRNIPPCKACGIAPSVKAGCCYRARLTKLLLEMLLYITPTNKNDCIIMLTECTPNQKTLPPITAK